MTKFLTLSKKSTKSRKVIWLLACLEDVLILANNIIIYGSFVQIVRNILLKYLSYNWRLIANHSAFWSDSLWLRSKYNCGHEKFPPIKWYLFAYWLLRPLFILCTLSHTCLLHHFLQNLENQDYFCDLHNVYGIIYVRMQKYCKRQARCVAFVSVVELSRSVSRTQSSKTSAKSSRPTLFPDLMS